MRPMAQVLSPYWRWGLLALPAAGFAAAITGSTVPKAFLHPIGALSAWFMISAIIASPLTLLLKGWRGPT